MSETVIRCVGQTFRPEHGGENAAVVFSSIHPVLMYFLCTCVILTCLFVGQ